MAYLKFYQGNPTSGSTDGTEVTSAAPVDLELDAAINEEKTIKLAVRCEAGYYAKAGAVISDNGDTNDRWKVSLSENGAWSDSVTIDSAISATANTIFFAKASSSSLEAPNNDSSVRLKCAATFGAV